MLRIDLSRQVSMLATSSHLSYKCIGPKDPKPQNPAKEVDNRALARNPADPLSQDADSQ